MSITSQTSVAEQQTKLPRRTRKPRLPDARHSDLMRLYVKRGYITTKKATKDFLESMGFRASPESIDEYMCLGGFVHRQRETRVVRRYEAKFGARPKAAEFTKVSPKGNGRSGDIWQRLSRLRERAVAVVARQTFRHGAAGGTSMQVGFAASTAAVGYQVIIDSNRDTYRGSFKGWAATEDHHRITVPKDWRIRVRRRGLAVLGGLMTLDAHPLPSSAGVELYAAVWASQGRGYGVNTHRGFIAVSGDESFHAEAIDDALKGLNRKIRAQGREPVISSLEVDVDAFIQRFSKYKNVPVSISHARESGSCEFGILSWCESVGIDPDDYEVPMSVVLEGFRKLPLVEVRRAVMFAVREAREERRALKAQLR